MNGDKMNVIKVCDAGAVWWHVTKGEMNGEFETVADYISDEQTAYLIAAAPDLLRALKDALDGLKNPAAHPVAQAARVKSVRAAIAKAEGDAA